MSNYYTKSEVNDKVDTLQSSINDTKNDVDKIGKLLWTGSFSSGSITVNGLSKYNVICVQLMNTVLCFGNKNYGIGGASTYHSYANQVWGYRLANEGDNMIINESALGGSNGSENVPITAIYGMF